MNPSPERNGHIRVRKARLYSRPANPPALFCAALSEETSKWAGNWAEGLLTTVDDNLNEAKEKIAAFQQKAGKKPIHLQLSFCYARSWKEAVEHARSTWKISDLFLSINDFRIALGRIECFLSGKNL